MNQFKEWFTNLVKNGLLKAKIKPLPLPNNQKPPLVVNFTHINRKQRL